MNPSTVFAREVRLFCRAGRITYADLADLAGFNESYLRNIVSRAIRPSLRRMQRIVQTMEAAAAAPTMMRNVLHTVRARRQHEARRVR